MGAAACSANVKNVGERQRKEEAGKAARGRKCGGGSPVDLPAVARAFQHKSNDAAYAESRDVDATEAILDGYWKGILEKTR